MPTTPYIKPGFFTTRVFNPVVSFLAGRLELSMKGARVLSAQGRKSGGWHSTPVNPLSFKGQRYLVAPRGETQWARNIRVSRAGRLTVGGKVEIVRVEEVPDHAKPPILRAYLVSFRSELADGPHWSGAGDDADAPALGGSGPLPPESRRATTSRMAGRRLLSITRLLTKASAPLSEAMSR
jgi:hypothetical protein